MALRRAVLWCLLLLTVLWGAVMQIEINGYINQPSTLEAKPLSADCQHPHAAAIVDLELASTPACFVSLIAPVSSTQEANSDRFVNLTLAKLNTKLDLIFIALYCLTFLSFAWMYWSGLGTARIFGLAAAIFAIFTAALDIREDVLLFRAFSAVAQGSNSFTPSHSVSLIKWLALGFTITILGCLPLRDAKRLRKLVGGLLILSGILVAGGALFYSNPLTGMKLLSLTLLLALVCYFPSDLPFSAILGFAYVLRFPIIATLLLAVILPMGYFAAPSIFVGLFDAIAPTSYFLICFTALLLSLVIMITARLTLAYGPERFCDLSEYRGWTRVSWLPTLLFSLLSVPMILLTWIGTENPGFRWPARVGEILLAALCAFLFLVATAELHAWFEIPSAAHPTVCFIYPPFRTLRPHEGASRLTLIFSKLLAWILPQRLQPGLVKVQTINGTDVPLLRSGHRLAATAFFGTLVLYTGIGVATAPRWWEHGPAAMVYILFLLCLLTWLFGGLAFFFDRLRLPVLTTIIAASVFSASSGGTDHVFELTKPRMPVALLNPTDVIHSWVDHRKDPGAPIVVVATAGGGIRASAWTTQVLTGLAEGCRQANKNLFTSSVVLISSVSGGSEGAMYFAGWYDDKGNTDFNKAKAVRDESAQTDLGAVGWGLLYPDLLRTVPGPGILKWLWPSQQYVDRGWALERQWINHWTDRKSSPAMSDWTTDVKNGTRPAVIFNGTVSEGGERFVAATTRLYEQTVGNEQGTIQFFDSYPKADLPVSTAARLSATFPFVSPMARADSDRRRVQFHIADGGYYDNSGLLSATQWIRAANLTLQDHRVVLIIVDSTPGAEPLGTDWGWQRQAIAPVSTLLEVRTSSQQLRGWYEQGLVKDLLVQELGDNPPPLTPVYFHFQGSSITPLSWHLTPKQLDEIGSQWLTPNNRNQADQVYKILHCSEPSATKVPTVRDGSGK